MCNGQKRRKVRRQLRNWEAAGSSNRGGGAKGIDVFSKQQTVRGWSLPWILRKTEGKKIRSPLSSIQVKYVRTWPCKRERKEMREFLWGT